MHAFFVQSIFLTTALTLAGVVHVAWLRTAFSSRFKRPIDGERTFRGRRVFGANKTWAGLMAMPVAGAAFVALGYVLAPERLTFFLWPLSVAEAAGLGAVLGGAALFAELPNSFVKRQLGVCPGETIRTGRLAAVLPLVDRLDSLAGVLVALSLTVGLTFPLALAVLVLGVTAHAALSCLMFVLGLKRRAL